LYEIIGRPVVTEKTTIQQEEGNKVVFRVHQDANKIQIRQAVEQLFFTNWDRVANGAPIVGVNTARMPGKPKRVGRIQGRRSAYKKAIITLHPDASIEFYESEGEV
jgi:large subunit ribosomal protein L23